jgi:thiol:disulfide interchange protein DsbD
VAIYLLALVLPEWELYLWAGLLIVTAVYLRALQSLPDGASGWQYFWKGIGVLLLVWGVLALLGAMAGSRDILRPLDLNRMLAAPAGSAAAPAENSTPLFTRVASIAELDARLAAAQAARKPVVIDYYADWCTYCVKMERSTFLDPAVRRLLRERFVAIQIDVTDPADAEVKALKARYQVFAPPAYLFVSPSGRFLKEHNFYGYQSAEEFAATLKRAAAES